MARAPLLELEWEEERPEERVKAGDWPGEEALLPNAGRALPESPLFQAVDLRYFMPPEVNPRLTRTRSSIRLSSLIPG
jgi:hypothetical protein